MSYKEYAEAHKSEDFAPFIKAKHVKSFPLKVEVTSVDQQKLPKTGDSLVARIKLDAKLRTHLKPEYIEQLEKAKANDVAFPLNKNNAKAFAEIFGDSMKKWVGMVTIMAVPVTNPQTGQLTQGLVVLTEGN